MRECLQQADRVPWNDIIAIWTSRAGVHSVIVCPQLRHVIKFMRDRCYSTSEYRAACTILYAAVTMDQAMFIRDTRNLCKNQKWLVELAVWGFKSWASCMRAHALHVAVEAM